MDETLDIFRGPEFHAATLDQVADNIPYIPQALGNLGLFSGANEKRIRTTTVEIFWKNGEIHLVPTTERGAPEPLPDRGNSEAAYLKTVRVAERDRIWAHELQDALNARLPLGTRLANAQEEVTERASRLRSNNELTMEHHRLGALQGLLLDADGTTVIRNYFNEFGVAQPAAVNINFSTIAENELVNFFEVNFVRPMLRLLRTAGRITPTTRIAALVGDNFWAGLMTNETIFKIYMQANSLRLLQPLAQPWGQFDFAGITFINYLGTDDGTTIAIPTNEARFFPVGATDVFRTYWSPGERFRDVNQKGQPVYFIVTPDPRQDMDEWVDVRVRSYPLFACIFPGVLMRAVRTG